jgi:hypothetical protein
VTATGSAALGPVKRVFDGARHFEAHNQTPHVQGWFAQLSNLAEDGVTVRRMHILGNESGVLQ